MKDWHSDKSDERRNLSRRARALLPGMLIGAVLVTLVWAISALVADGSDSGASLIDAPGHRSVPSRAPSPVPNAPASSPTQAQLQRCLRVTTAQGPVLRDAGAAVAQWQVHIGAMNKLVAGALTLQQAKQFWAQSRVGARDRLIAFDGALRHLNEPPHDCGQASAVGAAQPTGMKLRRCELAVSARDDVLHAARDALSTWRMHMKHMDMLRSGMLSPSRAEALWIKSWHQGQQEVDRFRSEMRKAHVYATICAGT
jgi:hypothetical protein